LSWDQATAAATVGMGESAVDCAWRGPELEYRS
jgi:hypothetical protein